MTDPTRIMMLGGFRSENRMKVGRLGCNSCLGPPHFIEMVESALFAVSKPTFWKYIRKCSTFFEFLNCFSKSIKICQICTLVLHCLFSLFWILWIRACFEKQRSPYVKDKLRPLPLLLYLVEGNTDVYYSYTSSNSSTFSTFSSPNFSSRRCFFIAYYTIQYHILPPPSLERRPLGENYILWGC